MTADFASCYQGCNHTEMANVMEELEGQIQSLYNLQYLFPYWNMFIQE